MLKHSPVEMLPERSTDPIKRYRVRARVQIAKTESNDAQVVPKRVVHFSCIRVEVEEQHEEV